jgi:hypothetical protein
LGAGATAATKTTFFDLDIYNDDFFEKLSGVTNALDNVEARKNTK